jgi:hypothetical protein
VPDSAAPARTGYVDRVSGSRRNALLVALLAAASVAATVVAAELALRIARGDLFARPSSGSGPMRLADSRGSYPAAYDPRLGYALRTGTSGTGNVWDRAVTIGADGLRESGGPRPPGRPILALGDSFTFGDEVDDADTWPAQLEAMLGRPVLNGGVFGYGLDQIVLRGEQLLDGAASAADAVILSVLPEDVLRCEYSYRYAWKPYFEIANGELVLRNVPVPRPHEGPPGESRLRRGLRQSFVADRAFRWLDPDGWGVPDSVHVHRDGGEVARRLLERWIARMRGERRALLLVIQWSPQMIDVPVADLVTFARDRGVPVLELRPVLEPIVRSRGIGAAFYLHMQPGQSGIGHMNPAGNRITAEAIEAALRAHVIDAPALPAMGGGM